MILGYLEGIARHFLSIFSHFRVRKVLFAVIKTFWGGKNNLFRQYFE